jgi:monoamine oxidase
MGDDTTWTRRRFLQLAGEVGGAAAVYESMVALGMLRVPSDAYAQRLEIEPGSGTGKTIVILGAGIAGLTAAYELKRRNSGHTIIVLEANDRPGGRSYTVRHGNEIVERHGDEILRQKCEYDKDQYLNAGPGRIPYHHRLALHYCRELKVAVEPYVMTSRANLYQNTIPKKYFAEPMPNRRILNDTRGYIAELLTKAIQKGSLDDRIPDAGERSLLLDLLANFGLLNSSGDYNSSQRSGYSIQPGVITPGKIEEKIPRDRLLGSKFWLDRMYQPEDYEWQPTLFQPVGGMDMLARGFLPVVEPFIRYNREVTKVSTEDGKVVVRHRSAGKAVEEETVTADWCISTIPVWILNRLIDPSKFSEAFRYAIAAPKGAPTCKVGWQANRRFWELDDEIYGGISYINHTITQFWYPSNGYLHQEKGVLTGTYNYGTRAEFLGAKDLDERRRIAAEGGEFLHGQAFRDAVPIPLGLSIAWQYVPYQEGGWADWSKADPKHYQTLLKPDNGLIVAGDQVSYLPGWQEGAMLSAHHVLARIAARQPALRMTAPEVNVVPDSRGITEGSGPGRDGAS